jgi:hypothetical protein
MPAWICFCSSGSPQYEEMERFARQIIAPFRFGCQAA